MVSVKRAGQRTLNFLALNPVSAGVAATAATVVNPWRREDRKTSVGKSYHNLRDASADITEELDRRAQADKLRKEAAKAAADLLTAVVESAPAPDA